MESANSIAIAGGAIIVSLIETMIARGILSADDARGVLVEAQERLVPFTMSADAAEAVRIIGDLHRRVA